MKNVLIFVTLSSLFVNANCSGGLSSVLLGTLDNVTFDVLEVGNFGKLVYTKLGVAFAMFVGVLFACGLPLVVVDCFRTRNVSKVSSSESSASAYSASYQESNTNNPDQFVDNTRTPAMSKLSHGAKQKDREDRNSPGSPTPEDNEFAGQWNEDSDDSLIQQNLEDKNKKNEKQKFCNGSMHVWISRITCFAAGIFLSTGFMDLFPDVNDTVSAAMSMLKSHCEYPLASLFTLLGFFIVLVVEQSVIAWNQRGQQIHTAKVDHTTIQINPESTENEQNHLLLSHAHEHTCQPEVAASANSLHVFVLLAALSLHSVFEGLAVGLQRSIQEVLALFSALMLHKLIMAASIGFNLARVRYQRQIEDNVLSKKSTRMQVICTVFFALASPIGVLIGCGIITQHSSGTLLLTIAILQGFACGTFFFVVFCEILPKEFKEGTGDRIGKLVSVMMGFVLVALYMLFQSK